MIIRRLKGRLFVWIGVIDIWFESIEFGFGFDALVTYMALRDVFKRV